MYEYEGSSSSKPHKIVNTSRFDFFGFFAIACSRHHHMRLYFRHRGCPSLGFICTLESPLHVWVRKRVNAISFPVLRCSLSIFVWRLLLFLVDKWHFVWRIENVTECASSNSFVLYWDGGTIQCDMLLWACAFTHFVMCKWRGNVYPEQKKINDFFFTHSNALFLHLGLIKYYSTAHKSFYIYTIEHSHFHRLFYVFTFKFTFFICIFLRSWWFGLFYFWFSFNRLCLEIHETTVEKTRSTLSYKIICVSASNA